jgi:catalase
MFDAVALVLSDTAGKMLAREATAVDFMRDAFGHRQTREHRLC